MARQGTTLENEAAQSTTSLGPLVGLAREDEEKCRHRRPLAASNTRQWKPLPASMFSTSPEELPK